MSKSKIPIDSDTTVKISKQIIFTGNNATYEEWSFDGIYGKSVILDIEDYADYEDSVLLEMARQHFELNEEELMTIKRTDEFVFVNFGFQTF